ncbi:MAG: hypothetical protein HQL52_20275 [Magnetococcales bacterium]|nr:hypothetical protein [Magnetococcales bacterium]
MSKSPPESKAPGNTGIWQWVWKYGRQWLMVGAGLDVCLILMAQGEVFWGVQGYGWFFLMLDLGLIFYLITSHELRGLFAGFSEG